MPANDGPGQQAMPNAIRAIPATRATGMAAPASSAPSSNCPTSAGTITSATPVAASAIAAAGSTHFNAVPGIGTAQGCLGGFVASAPSLKVSLSILPVNLNGES